MRSQPSCASSAPADRPIKHRPSCGRRWASPGPRKTDAPRSAIAGGLPPGHAARWPATHRSAAIAFASPTTAPSVAGPNHIGSELLTSTLIRGSAYALTCRPNDERLTDLPALSTSTGGAPRACARRTRPRGRRQQRPSGSQLATRGAGPTPRGQQDGEVGGLGRSAGASPDSATEAATSRAGSPRHRRGAR